MTLAIPITYKNIVVTLKFATCFYNEVCEIIINIVKKCKAKHSGTTFNKQCITMLYVVSTKFAKLFIRFFKEPFVTEIIDESWTNHLLCCSQENYYYVYIHAHCPNLYQNLPHYKKINNITIY